MSYNDAQHIQKEPKIKRDKDVINSVFHRCDERSIQLAQLMHGYMRKNNHTHFESASKQCGLTPRVLFCIAEGYAINYQPNTLNTLVEKLKFPADVVFGSNQKEKV